MLSDSNLLVSDTNLTHTFHHIQDRSAIYWSDENFLLFANHFAYQVNGEQITSMDNSIIRWKEDSFTTPHSQNITYGWYENDSSCTKRKFDMLLSLSETGTWRMEEIGVFSSRYERKAFIPGVNMYSGEEIFGSLNSCYRKGSLTLLNNDGDSIQFSDLSIVPFFDQWNDTASALDCMVASSVVSIEFNANLTRSFIKRMQKFINSYIYEKYHFKLYDEQIVAGNNNTLLLWGWSPSYLPILYCWSNYGILSNVIENITFYESAAWTDGGNEE